MRGRSGVNKRGNFSNFDVLICIRSNTLWKVYIKVSEVATLLRYTSNRYCINTHKTKL